MSPKKPSKSSPFASIDDAISNTLRELAEEKEVAFKKKQKAKKDEDETDEASPAFALRAAKAAGDVVGAAKAAQATSALKVQKAQSWNKAQLQKQNSPTQPARIQKVDEDWKSNIKKKKTRTNTSK